MATTLARRAAGDWQRTRRRAFLAGLLPTIGVLAAITVAPALFLLVVSLTPLNLVNPRSAFDFSAPLANYADLLADDRFLHSAWVQARLSTLGVGLQLAVGLGMALLLNARSRWLAAVRSVFLIPMVLPPIVAALVWKVLLTPDVSPIHRLADAAGLPFGSLITNADTALLAIALADTWQWFPFTMLMVLAALQMMPDEPMDAARIDGADRWQLFVHIVFPYIRGALVVAGLFRLIDSLKAFPMIYVLTNGGPGMATEVTNFYAFQQAFNFSYWGYASAIATLMLAAALGLSWLVGRLGWERNAHD